MGWRLESEGTRVYLWLDSADVWQRPSRHYKAIIFQLKKKKRIALGLGWLWVLTPQVDPAWLSGGGDAAPRLPALLWCLRDWGRGTGPPGDSGSLSL